MIFPGRRTFRSYTLFVEISALVLTFAVLFAAIGLTLSEMNRKYLELRLADVGRVRLFLERSLEEAKETLEAFENLPETERTPAVMNLFSEFSDIYRLDRGLQITRIYKASPGSKVFRGFSFSSGKLAGYLNSVGERREFSEIMRGYEDDEPSVYFAIPQESHLYLGRLNLSYIRNFLAQFSRFSGNPVMLISKDGFVMLSSDADLRIPAFDLGKWEGAPSASRTLWAGDRHWIPVISEKRAIGAGIVVLIPTELLDVQRNALLAFLCTFMGILILLVVIKNRQLYRLVVQPIAYLSDKMGNLEKGRYPSDDADVNHGFEELAGIQARFRSMADVIAQREHLLSESEQKYRLLTERMKDVVWKLDLETMYFVYVSPSVESLRGYTAEEIVAEPVDVALTPETAGALKSLMRQRADALLSGRVPADHFYVNDVEQPRKDGSTVWTEVVTTYGLNGENGHVEVIGVTRDIAERKRAEQSLRESEEKFRLAFDNANTGMCLVDLRGKLLQVNEKMSAIFGYEKRELENMSVNDLAVSEDVGLSTEFIHRAVDGTADHEKFEKRYRHRQDHVIHGLVASSLVRDAQSRPLYFISQVEDIGERKLYEHELRQARDAAERAARAKSEFLSNTSHEIRTPLNGIVGMVQILEHTQLTDEQKECLHTIETSSNNLLSLINNILDLSKIEAGKIELEQVDFSLRDCLGEVVAIQSSLVWNKGLSLRIEIPDDVPDNLNGDQLRLKQILLNLLGNAVKFTNQGGVCTTVAVAKRRNDIVFLKISVTDSGIGIGAEAIEKIFDPFTQADASTTRRYGGTGLGLSICARFAELMGGRILAESTVGKGSAFSLEVPFAVNAAGCRDRQGGDQPPARLNDPPSGMLAPSSSDAAPVPVARELLAVLLAEIESLLQTRDMAVTDKTLELVNLAPTTASIDTLRHRVRQCDFDRAFDAGYGRVRGVPATEGGRFPAEHSGHIRNRFGAGGRRVAGASAGRRGLHHQADQFRACQTEGRQPPRIEEQNGRSRKTDSRAGKLVEKDQAVGGDYPHLHVLQKYSQRAGIVGTAREVYHRAQRCPVQPRDLSRLPEKPFFRRLKCSDFTIFSLLMSICRTTPKNRV